MNYLKLVFALSIFVLFTGLFSAQAQTELQPQSLIDNAGVAALTKIRVPQEAKDLVIKHLKASKTKGPSVQRAMKELNSGNLVGFNIGMPPTKNIIIIIFVTDQDIKRADRLPTDALKNTTEVWIWPSILKKQGISPNKSMGFFINTQHMKIEKFSGVPGTGK